MPEVWAFSEPALLAFLGTSPAGVAAVESFENRPIQARATFPVVPRNSLLAGTDVPITKLPSQGSRGFMPMLEE